MPVGLFALLLAALLLTACTPPAPTPTPAPATADLSTLRPTATTALTPTVRPSSTPFPPTVLTPGTHPAPPEGETATPDAYPLATATPEPYPIATADSHPYEQEGQVADTAPRLGANATMGAGVLFCDGRDWQSWWAPSHAKIQVNCEGLATLPEHVPMLVWSPATFEEARARETYYKFQPIYWLVFNECEHQEQCHTPPEEAARWYHDVGWPFARSLSPDVRLIVGGVNASDCGMGWLERFVTFYRLVYEEDVPRAGWHLHLYPDVTAYDCTHPWQWNWPILHDVDVFWQEWLVQAANVKRFVMVYGREGDEVWISEASCLAPPPAICTDYIYTIAERSLQYYDGDGRWIDRFTWFADGGLDGDWNFLNLWSGNHEGEPLEIRPLGELWLGHDPLPAVPLEIYERRFPIIGFGADVVPPRPEGTPPAAYP